MVWPKVPQRTTSGFAFSVVQRAFLECIAVRKFGAAEMAEAIAFFAVDPPQCAFCGDTEIRRWDHLVPVFSGGDTVLGNMVAACSRCDDSKRHLPYAEWALSNARHSPKTRGIPDLDSRLKRIAAYVSHYNYAPKDPATRLTPLELEHFERICADLTDARKEFDLLINSYRARTGLK